ncbi:MAG: cupin domain-containing protein [Nitrosopumilaceae archaeon]
MKKGNVFTMKMNKKLMEKTKKYFVGRVVLQDISKIIRSKEEKMYHVTFKKGARTKLHYHQAGQILIPTGGKGTLVICDTRQIGSNIKIKKTEGINLVKGDTVYIPARKLHWHGAVGKSNFSHIAINAKLPGYKEAKTIWYESDFETFAKKIS